MLKILLAAFLFLSYSSSLISMDKLSEKHRSELKNRIEQIESAMKFGPTYYWPRGDDQNYIASQKKIISDILNQNSISLTQDKNWLENLKDNLNSNNKSSVCDITGLDKATVIKALFDAAFHKEPYSTQRALAEKDLAEALKNLSKIEWLSGRPMKVDLSKDTFDTCLYNRDNGSNAAQKAIAQLRKKLQL